jgi:hypothetical protein
MRIIKHVSLICMLAFVLSACSGSETSENLDNNDAVDSTLATVVSDSLVLELTGVDSLTVFDILLANHEVDYFSTAAGIFVKGIDSIEGGAKLFWVYTVNDSMAQVAADQYVTQSGDRIKWHFRRIQPQ